MSITDVPRRSPTSARLYLGVDLAATLLFAVEGASVGVRAHLDLLGVLVVGFCTALVGGVLRDLLMGDTPPAAFRSPVRIILALAGGLIAFVLAATVAEVPAGVLVVLDAFALGLFAVSGADKALQSGANGWVVVMLGTITAVGGGVVRDVLVNTVPVVLVASVYATAAAAGALAVWIAARLRWSPIVGMSIGFVVCTLLRLAAVAFDWQLPHAG
ncbi:trimeric intracellular cation channel family protein [Glaciibacter flavus]|uniref:trimeric intracellular cation channel family protein n=1 Tax=Orlajensenia flava TaxID=2565934 RepID=UPI003AFF7BDB